LLSDKGTAFRHLSLLIGIWVSYVLGAICGCALELHMALSALVFPLGILVALIVVDVIRPLRPSDTRISHDTHE